MFHSYVFITGVTSIIRPIVHSGCASSNCVDTHTGSSKIKHHLYLIASAPPEAGIGSRISPLRKQASGGADRTGCAAVNPSCSWLGCSRVGCLSKIIALEGAAICSFKLCSVVKHKIASVSLSAYIHYQVCCWTNSNGGSTRLRGSQWLPYDCSAFLSYGLGVMPFMPLQS